MLPSRILYNPLLSHQVQSEVSFFRDRSPHAITKGIGCDCPLDAKSEGLATAAVCRERKCDGDEPGMDKHLAEIHLEVADSSTEGTSIAQYLEYLRGGLHLLLSKKGPSSGGDVHVMKKTQSNVPSRPAPVCVHNLAPTCYRTDTFSTISNGFCCLLFFSSPY